MAFAIRRRTLNGTNFHPFFGPNFGTKGALRPPTAYDNHPFHPTIHPIRPSTYSCEDDLSIEDLISSIHNAREGTLGQNYRLNILVPAKITSLM